MKEFYKGKQILITGGAGYVGQLLTDRLLEYDPEVIRLLDTHETSLFNLRQRYAAVDPERLRFLLGDVRNLNRLQYAFSGIDIVFHAAAYKHVEECEYNPIDAVDTNINGTSNVIQAALNNNVQKVIFTSSDKAANPSTTMGATKLLAEKLIIAANGYRGVHPTVFACCRFGNVIRSSGSVIPLFENQIKDNGELTITDPEMTRFIITPEKAVDLVLLSAIKAQGGEVFILKMPAINIGDLADAMIAKYGSATKKIVGKKPGEKMYEELMTEEEMSRAYENDDLYVVFPELVNTTHVGYHEFGRVSTVPDSRGVMPLSQEKIKELLE